MPRKIFIIGGVIAAVLAAFVLYVNFFGVPGVRLLKTFLMTRSPHAAEAQAMLGALADVSVIKLSGVVSGNTGRWGLGLASFISQVSSTAVLADTLTLRLETQTELKTIGHNTYYADVEVRRSKPEHFYFFVSRATAPPEVAEQLAPLLRRWVSVANDLISEITPEQVLDTNVEEPQLIEAARATLKKTPFVTFTRKISNTEFEFSITKKNLAIFLGTLFGDLSDKLFSDDELLALQDSFANYAIFGRITLDAQTHLPHRLNFRQGSIIGELDVSYPPIATQITTPKNVIDIHDLLGK